MKNYLNTFLALVTCGALFAGNAGKPAYEALEFFEPLIGDWEGKSETIGIFEGLPGQGTKKTINKSTYRWLVDKTAVQREWKTLEADGKTVINIGTSIYTLDPVTKNIVSTNFGYDGSVYWTGHGRATGHGKKFTFDIEEVTINGTYTDYTMQLHLEGKNVLKWKILDVTQNQKKLPDSSLRRMKRK